MFFGLPGGGPNLEMVGAGMEMGMRFVLAHGETASCIMASTFGKLTSTVGVTIATRGPGAASAVNGAAQATLDRYPLLLLTDVIAASDRDRVAHQRLDQIAMMRPVTKWSGTVGHSDPANLIAAALSLASTQPYGAVHLDFDPSSHGSDTPKVAEPAGLDPEALTAARKLIRRARRPLFLIGAEAIRWTQVVRATVAELGVPALLTYQAKGIVPVSSPNYAGLFTNGRIEASLLASADLIVAIGLDPVEPIPGPWNATAPVVSLNPWPIESPYYPIEAELTGPIDSVLGMLGGEFSSEWDEATGSDYNRKSIESLRQPGRGLGPFEVVETLIASAREGTVATVDAGAHFLAVMPLWPVEKPFDLLVSNGLATMGFAVPAAIGAALARPDSPVICMVGDGGMGMTLAELETVVRLDLDVTIIVFNDSALSLIKIKQREGQGGDEAVRYGDINFASVAQGVGMQSYVVETPAALAAALDSARGPLLIDARIDPGPYVHAITATRYS